MLGKDNEGSEVGLEVRTGNRKRKRESSETRRIPFISCFSASVISGSLTSNSLSLPRQRDRERKERIAAAGGPSLNSSWEVANSN